MIPLVLAMAVSQCPCNNYLYAQNPYKQNVNPQQSQGFTVIWSEGQTSRKKRPSEIREILKLEPSY